MSVVTLEELSRSALVMLRDALPAALVAVHDERVAADTQWFSTMGTAYVDTPLPAPVTWDVGHNEYLLQLPLERFPTCTVSAFDSDADPGLEIEQADVVVQQLECELWVYDPDIAAVNRKAWRYGDAAARVFAASPTLDGAALPARRVPHVQVSQSTARRVSEFTDEIVYVQGVRVTYGYEVATTF